MGMCIQGGRVLVLGGSVRVLERSFFVCPYIVCLYGGILWICAVPMAFHLAFWFCTVLKGVRALAL